MDNERRRRVKEAKEYREEEGLNGSIGTECETRGIQQEKRMNKKQRSHESEKHCGDVE